MKFLLKKYRFSVFFITLIQLVYGKNGKLHKTKRALLFPASSTLGIFIAIAVPLDLPNRNVFMSYNFEANYNLPFEGAHYIPGPLQRFTEFADEGRNEKVSSEEQSDAGIDHVAKRSPGSLLSRKHVYTILEDKFNAFGYDGRTCLLRLICEVNAAFLGKNNGFLGDLFQIIFGKLNHPNIVGFKGFKVADDGVESLVLECCKTSLGEILENRLENTLGPLEATLILKMCADITKGLDYLHSKAHLLHGDIKSHNILVKGNFEICKLCDFGVSLPLDENMMIDFEKHAELEYVGTQLWSAPEVIENEKTICHKADIFSFGLVVYETISLIPPHTWILHKDEVGNGKEGLDNSMVNEDSLLGNEIDQVLGSRPPLPEASSLSKEYNKVVEIFYICTNNLPEDRPSARTLSQILNSDNI